MTEQNAIVKQDDSMFLSPVASMAQFADRYNVFKDFVSGMLKAETDYSVIPGSTKPSLVKPGAEKLCTLFGLTPRFNTVDKVEDWLGADHGGEPFFYYKYNCDLYRGARIVATCEGSCNSWEVKYRYRQGERKCPTCGMATIIPGKKEWGGGWLCFKKKGGCGAKFVIEDPAIANQIVGRITNPDVADLVNTFQKMAQKRAFVGATLLATNASEYFTQDLDDQHTPGDEPPVDATFTDVPEPQPAKVKVVSEEMIMRYDKLCDKADTLGLTYPPYSGDWSYDTLAEAGKALKQAIADKESEIK